MVYLTKNTAPLLRLVKGQPYASDKDHEDARSESAKSAGEENVNREPDDSSDEENTGPSYKPPPTVKHVRAPARRYLTTNIHSAPDSKQENNKDYGTSKSSGFKRPAGSEPRKQVEEEKYADLTERNVFSGSQEKGKRLKRTFTKKGPSSSQPEGKACIQLTSRSHFDIAIPQLDFKNPRDGRLSNQRLLLRRLLYFERHAGLTLRTDRNPAPRKQKHLRQEAPHSEILEASSRPRNLIALKLLQRPGRTRCYSVEYRALPLFRV